MTRLTMPPTPTSRGPEMPNAPVDTAPPATPPGDTAAPAAAPPAAPDAASPSSAGPRLEVRGLSVRYGAVEALRDVTMTIAPNAVTALIGPSGCGKSTFLRALNRMHELTPGARVSGRVALDGVDVYGDGVDPVRVRRRIGMVFQQPNPFPTMSIRGNVAAGLRLTGRRIPRAELDARVERALRAAHLWDEVKDRLDQPGARLSGGQQQRLCIARAIAVEPDVLLMDEPCSALDPIATAAIERLIAELRRRYTIVIVTHNMQQAARASDETAFFNVEGSGRPGRLVEHGETARIFSAPAHPATADYIGGRFG